MKESIVIIMSSGIYKIINTTNGKFYIGRSKNIEKRWVKQHIPQLRKNKHKNDHLQNAWNKYGEVFNLEIVELVAESKLIEREQYYMDTLHPEYNIGPAKSGGDIISTHPKNKEIRARMKLVKQVLIILITGKRLQKSLEKK